LFILPNLAFSIFSAVPHIGQSWSIGVEEQFYLFWPLIIKKLKPTLKLILIILFSIIFLKLLFFIISSNYSNFREILIFKKFIAMSKFESMIIGAFGAIILFEKHDKLLSIFLNKKLFYFSVLCFFPLNYFLFYNVLQNGIHVIISFMFLVIILNLVHNPKYKTLFENKILNYLGSISYGIYMYHLIVIPFVIAFFKTINDNVLFNFSVYLFSIIFSILISGFSFKYFESYFLSIKKKYEK
jgi:peptidoglycan/LPS O-acetylase OafA/YrhL